VKPEQVAAELAREPHLWWGHHPEHGWVVLDREDARNGGDSRHLVRCRDWSTLEVSRKEFGSVQFVGFKTYLAALPAARAREACDELLRLRSEFASRAAGFRVTRADLARQRAELGRQFRIRRGDWFNASDPTTLIELLGPGGFSLRKRRLFGVGCSRRVWDLMTFPDVREAILLAERLAEGEVTHDQVRQFSAEHIDSWQAGYAGSSYLYRLFLLTIDQILEEEGLASRDFLSTNAVANIVHLWRPAAEARAWPQGTGSAAYKKELAAQADLLRELLGDPFHPVRFDPTWRTAAVLEVASGIYARRAFDGLPILADALEEAGCDQAALLPHLRQTGPHTLGCWALDAVLDRERDAVYPAAEDERRQR
jgi:hypothetical protein